VGAYRSGDVDVAHPLTSMIARLRRQPAGPRLLCLESLTSQGQAAMVADLLNLDPGSAMELASLIALAAAGNPYDTVAMVNALRQDGLLTRGGSGWRWDEAALRGRYAHADVRGLLATRVASLPPRTRRILAVMACLAGRVDLELLGAAAGLTEHEVERRLAPAFAAGLLVAQTDGPRSVRFHHDRIQESVLGTLTPEARGAVRLDLARRLAALDEFPVVAAEQYLAVTDDPRFTRSP